MEKHPPGTVKRLDPHNPEHLATLLSFYGKHPKHASALVGNFQRGQQIQRLLEGNKDDSGK